MAREIEPNEDANAEETQTEKKPGFFKRILRRRWIVPSIAVLVLAHAAVIGYIRMTAGVGDEIISPEVTLGQFQFTSEALPDEPVTQADFQIHVSLLGEAEYEGRLMLQARHHKIQQEIEQLLRQAHARDFEDPLLTELKRQIQTMINEILAKQVVAEIIITDLLIDRMAAETGSSTPQSEQPVHFDANFEDQRSG